MVYAVVSAFARYNVSIQTAYDVFQGLLVVVWEPLHLNPTCQYQCSLVTSETIVQYRMPALYVPPKAYLHHSPSARHSIQPPSLPARSAQCGTYWA
jgi:hypothetical protein